MPNQQEGQLLLDAIEHRGPDSAGTVSDPDRGTWLGFRRLSVIDLDDRSDQPMRHPNGTVMVFNGEIYNYVELRSELESAGHTFATTGDTEVLLNGYVQWGRGVFERANGMWAAAFTEPSKPGVQLVRDRFGEKPLFYGADASGAWWFGSDAPALHRAGAGDKTLDAVAVRGFLVLGTAEPDGRSYFSGISQVPPGGSVYLSAGSAPRVESWFSLEDEFVSWRRNAAVGPAEVRSALLDAVRLRLRSDVEVGTSLSGGLDSGAIVAAVRSLEADRRVHAFTASFPGSDLDEFPRATMVAERHGVQLHQVKPSGEGFLQDLSLLVRRQGAPFESPSVYAQWCVMKAARDAGVTVLLDGQGADETWGGYQKYRALSVLHRGGFRAGLAAVRRQDSRSAVLAGLSAKTLGYMAPDTVRSLLVKGHDRTRRSLLGPSLDVALDDPVGNHRTVSTALEKALLSDLGSTILPGLLRFADRNSMAWGREIRLPFLDPAVAAMGLSTDWAADTEHGWSKRTLRQAFAGDLPESVVWNRTKMAYNTPTDQWMETSEARQRVAAATSHLVARGVLSGENAATSVGAVKVLTLSELIQQFDL